MVHPHLVSCTCVIVGLVIEVQPKQHSGKIGKLNLLDAATIQVNFYSLVSIMFTAHSVSQFMKNQLLDESLFRLWRTRARMEQFTADVV